MAKVMRVFGMKRESHGHLGLSLEGKPTYSNRRLSGVDPEMIEQMRRMRRPSAAPSNTTSPSRKSSVMTIQSVSSKAEEEEEEEEKKGLDLEELGITQKQLSEYAQAFSLFDEDGSGSISTDELAVILRSLGEDPSPEELEEMIAAADDNGNGMLEFHEFVTMMSGHMKNEAADEKRIRDAFMTFDKDNVGSVSAAELRHIMTTKGDFMTHEEVDEMIEELDIDGDGRISCEEFVAVVTGQYTKDD